MPSSTDRVREDPTFANRATSKKVPDGGWGWAIVAASFTAHMIADGCSFSFGIMYAELLDYFNESRAVTAWVNSLYVSFPLLAGPLAGAVTSRYGCRAATIMGGLMAGTGYILSFFASEIWMLYITLGLMAGIGTAFVYVPSVVVIAYYFEKRLSTATGIAVAGTGIGTFAFAPLIEYLNSVYTWRGTMLILGGLLFNITVCGFVYIPVEDNVSPASSDDFVTVTVDENVIDNDGSFYTNGITKDGRLTQSVVILPTYFKSEDSTNKKKALVTGNGDATKVLASSADKINSLQQLPGIKSHTTDHVQGLRFFANSHRLLLAVRQRGEGLSSQHRRQSISCPNMVTRDGVGGDGSAGSEEDENWSQMRNGGMRTLWREMKQTCLEMFDARLLRDFTFLFFALSSVFLYVSYDVPYVYTPDLMQSLVGKEESSHVIAISGVTNTFGQIAIGYLGDKPCLSSLYLYAILTALAGVVTFFVPLLSTYWQMCTYGGLYGLFISGSYALTSIVLVDMFGVDRLTSAFGALLLAQGVAGLIGPPLAGAVSDYTEAYSLAYFLAGVLMFISGVMLFAMPLLKRLRR